MDGTAVRGRTGALAAQLIEDEWGSLPPAFAEMEMAALLAEHPDIFAYLQVRLATVTSLIGELRGVANPYGVRVSVVPSVFTRPASKAWMEGVSLRQLPAVSDSIFVLSYFPPVSEVQADIRWVKLMAPGHPFVVGLMAGHPDTTGPGVLAEKARLAVREGAAGVTYYNCGLMSRTRLGWVRQANQAALAAR